MIKSLLPNPLRIITATSLLALAFPGCMNAVTITSGPTFTNAALAPLAGALQLTTDVPSRVSVSVSDGITNWTHDFLTYSTSHTETLLGFKSSRTNQISVTVFDSSRNSFTATRPVKFISPPLPTNFPAFNVLTSQPDRMEPGYTLFRLNINNGNTGVLVIVDSAGEVIWYSTAASTLDVRQLPDGNLFVPLGTSFEELGMLGQTVRTWSPPAAYGINSHEGVVTSHGTILYISDASRTVSNFPSSSTNPNAPLQTTTVDYNVIVEISTADSSVLNTWSIIDMLQANRIDYLTFTIRTPKGWDCEHANAVIEDTRDNSLIVSLRHQDAVIKFTRDGELVWILGPHENWGPSFDQYLLSPMGDPFEWSYAQHAPMITPRGTLLVYDDGNWRASPFDAMVPGVSNYSRAVEYEIDENNMEVAQVWDFGRTNSDRLYTDRLGNADWLPQTGNVLINFGNVDYENGAVLNEAAPGANMLRIKEVTYSEAPEVVFDLSVFNYANTNTAYLGVYAYRSHRIPDLYGHPVTPVSDLTVHMVADKPLLQFSGDPFTNYNVEVSSDLRNWQPIGTPDYTGSGGFDFTDDNASGHAVRYYRIVEN